jgi:iron complex outermembrane recepter protein
MSRHKLLCSALLGSAAALFATAAAASAEPHNFNIPGGDLQTALDAFTRQSGVEIIYPVDQVRRVRTGGVQGFMESEVALSRILHGTDFVEKHDQSGAVSVVKGAPVAQSAPAARIADVAAPAHAAAAVETVVVTSSKIKGDIQTVPIAITALSQEQLTSRQIAGGPDLVKEVPNLTFSKTNFTGYNIEIRGIGTQAISVTTDPAVAVAFNDIPFIRNHFFEQEFYDVSQVEVLRGPQGTLYGRNATAGVVNVISAKPTDQFEAMLSADWGNYHNRRYEGMVNIPIVDDRVDLRIAGEWTKRDGYSFNELTQQPIDGRDLWSTRVTLGFQTCPESANVPRLGAFPGRRRPHAHG